MLVIVVAFAAFSGSVVQSMIGFAAGGVAVPILLWYGVGGPEAIIFATSAATVQAITGLIKDWQYRPPVREFVLPIVLRYAFMPLGLLCLIWIDASGKTVMRQFVGGSLLVFIALMLIFRNGDKKRLHPFWTVGAFSSSGFFVGSIGIGGPPQALWTLAKGWTKETRGAFLYTTGLAMIPVQIAVFGVKFGDRILVPAGLGLLMSVIVVPVGTKLGYFIRNRIPERGSKIVVTVAIACIALVSLLAPLISRT